MTSLYRTAHTTDSDLKGSASNFGSKNLNFRNRNLSNSRLNMPQTFDLQFVKQTIESKKKNDNTGSTNHSKQLKKYCLNKLKASNGLQKFNAIRKNRSLKVFPKDQPPKLFNRTKIQPLSCEQLLPDRRESKDEVCRRQSSDKGKFISIKKRVELIKKNQYKLKITANDKQSKWSKDLPRSDVSLGDKLEAYFPQPQKQISSTNIQNIQSENILGEGLKKSSSSKIKVLVKNPFERMMKLQQSRANKKQSNPFQTSIQQLEQSRILKNLDLTISNFSNRCELQQILALMQK